MKRILRSKLFISIILLILCFILIFVLLPKNYEAQNQTMQVVQLLDDVELGSQITESMLVTKTIGRYGVDPSVITKKEDIVGKYAANDLRRSANLYSDMFVEEWEEVEGVIDTMLKPGDKLVTLSLANGAQSVGGQIRTGSIVDILTQKTSGVVYDELGYPVSGSESGGGMELTKVLEGVMVYKVQNSALEDISELRRQWISLLETGSSSAEEFDASMTPAFVTIIVSEEQAIKLVNQEYNGTVHLLLHPEILVQEEKEDEKNNEESKDQEPIGKPEDEKTTDPTSSTTPTSPVENDENTQGEKDISNVDPSKNN